MLTILIPFVAFLGFVVGAFLARVSPEEMLPGRPYFILLMRAISAAILVSLFYFSGFGLVGLLAGMVFGFFIRDYFFALGLAIAASFGMSSDALFLFSALTFAFGIVYGTRVKSSGRLTFVKFISKVLLFFLPFIILLIRVPPQPFMMFSAGAIAAMLVLDFWPKKI